MSEHPNATLVRRGFAAFGEADLTTLAEILAPDAEQHVPGDSAITGDYTSRDAIFGFHGQTAELTDGTFRADLENVFAPGDQVVAGFPEVRDRRRVLGLRPREESRANGSGRAGSGR